MSGSVPARAAHRIIEIADGSRRVMERAAMTLRALLAARTSDAGTMPIGGGAMHGIMTGFLAVPGKRDEFIGILA